MPLFFLMLPSDASAQRAQTAPQTKIAESSPAPQFQFNRIEAALTALCFIFMVAGIAAENLGAPTGCIPACFSFHT
ncbi:MAG: hypothetical protein DCC52_05035 [Chloroflexi bacterium]|nr:MAG: hypothetical protein DCC52_05035 [Chloroflexota bacterium]